MTQTTPPDLFGATDEAQLHPDLTRSGEGEDSQPQSTEIIEVLISVPLNTAFSYKAPQSWQLEVGDLVTVPFGKQAKIGVVWRKNVEAQVDIAKVKPVTDRLACPPIPASVVRLIDFVAGYYMAALGGIVSAALQEPGIRTALKKVEHFGASNDL